MWLAADELARQLQGAGVRVAVLGACESGRHDGISAWAGVAPALVARGVGAVVAMQYEVLDRDAIAFSEMFYVALAAGQSIDEAVAAGRQAMLGRANKDGVEWGVPVLYMRATDGILFPRLAEHASETGEQIRRVIRQTVKSVTAGATNVGIRAKRARGSFELIQDVEDVRGENTQNIGLEVDEL